MQDAWVISVPLDKTSSKSVEKLKRFIGRTNLASCCKFSIPDLKVGILDSLLSVSDELSTLDMFTESVMIQTCKCMREVMEQAGDKVMEDVLANGAHITKQKDLHSTLKALLKSLRVDMMSYVTNFQWDEVKYPTSLPLSSLVNIIKKEVSQVKLEFKSRAATYSSVKKRLQNLEHQQEGSLKTCSLNGIVRREDLVVSEYLTTLLVLVSRRDYMQWEKTYESLSEFVVPRSSRKLCEDRAAGIFSVTLFKRVVCDFIAKAKERNLNPHRFNLREYSFDLDEKQQQERMELSVHKKEHYVCLSRSPVSNLRPGGQIWPATSFYMACESLGTFMEWLKAIYNQVIISWIHLKALRVFVESVLRYGLPVNYQALLLQSDTKCSEKLREKLSSLFAYLDPTSAVSDVTCDIPGLSQQDYFSYICFPVNINLLDLS
ncbi:V-type proton ATPase subunit C 1-B isoform X1 [Nerophis lumbriciformis]|uniref:V-type proton ATPase subunit C 1-B isoform X1 n=1 Tax=Nerophis lumbriciformis TaxID=546530 RepID=UPI002AE06757|nr:V-type proton ATPase subunit C 1-B-like isoform X1 [Nerophis lumbriciformis]